MSESTVLSIEERLDAHTTLTGRGVCVAFVDTGFYPHADLMRPTRRVRMYADVTRDEASVEEFFTARPQAWHGTMAVCCACGNGHLSAGRYRGLAYEAEVVLIKAVADGGHITGKHVASAIRFPLRHPDLGVRVLNVSLGVNRDDPAAADVERAVGDVTDAGIVVVAAAGNTPDALPEPPASAPAAITVGGADDKNTREAGDDTPWPSSSGNGKPDLLAPALRLAAPMIPGTLTAREASALFTLRTVLDESSVVAMLTGSDDVGGQALLDALVQRIEQGRFISPHYQHVQGTSFAAPITSSVVAQMLEAHAGLTPRDVREGLLATARPLPDVPKSVQGAGMLSARAAVEWALARRP